MGSCAACRDIEDFFSLREVRDELCGLREQAEEAREAKELAESLAREAEAALGTRNDFVDKVSEMIGHTLPGISVQGGKEYLLLYRLEDILKDYRQLKDKGATSTSAPGATERTPDDRNCGRTG
jgi:hypothetical protein